METIQDIDALRAKIESMPDELRVWLTLLVPFSETLNTERKQWSQNYGRYLASLHSFADLIGAMVHAYADAASPTEMRMTASIILLENVLERIKAREEALVLAATPEAGNG